MVAYKRGVGSKSAVNILKALGAAETHLRGGMPGAVKRLRNQRQVSLSSQLAG